MTASLEAVLYTAKGTYELTLPAIKIDRPSEARNGTWRSAGILIQAVPDEPFLGISLASVGTSCGSSHAIVSQHPATSAAVPSERPDTLMASLLRDAIPNAGATVPTLTPGSQPPPCAEPFAKARTEILSRPQYPAIAREQGAVGLALR